MHHPVYQYFYYKGLLDPEGQTTIGRWSTRRAVACGLALLLFATIAVNHSVPHPQANEPAGTAGISQVVRLASVSGATAAEPVGMTQCALRDLRLVTSIEAHGEAQDIPADKLADAFFTMMNAREACTAGRIDEALATYDRIIIAFDTPRISRFTPRCAERDLRAIATIEEFGEIGEMQSAWLAVAGLNWLQARSHCLADAESEGIALYDRIIAGDTRMPNEWAMNERAR